MALKSKVNAALGRNQEGGLTDVALFRRIEGIDIRPLSSDIPNVTLIQADFMEPLRAILVEYCDSGRESIIRTAPIYGVMGPDQRIYEGSECMGGPIETPQVYSASRAAIVGLTKYFATCWGAQGVWVNNVTPGGVSSGHDRVFEDRYRARIPLDRTAWVDAMTEALVFLASDAPNYISGQNIIVDGGLSAW